MNILITGCAGFIGFHLSNKLLNKYKIIGIDNLNNYYDPKLKRDRLKILKKNKNFSFFKVDLLNYNKINKIIKKNKIKYVVHLAAQAGVRHSIKNRKTYFKSNIEGFFNVLELCKKNNIQHLIFASTSSVYGNNINFPLKEKSNTDTPLSFYAASKKTNEVMAYSYANIYNLPCTGVRFFTVYGPYGRPDMAIFKFTKNILDRNFINLFNYGKHVRDFTYIDDIVDGIENVIKKIPKNKIPFKIYNIGNGKPRKLLEYLKIIEKLLNKKAKVKKMPLQIGDIVKTHADVNLLKKETGYRAKTNIEEGIKNFLEWYLWYYKKN